MARSSTKRMTSVALALIIVVLTGFIPTVQPSKRQPHGRLAPRDVRATPIAVSDAWLSDHPKVFDRLKQRRALLEGQGFAVKSSTAFKRERKAGNDQTLLQRWLSVHADEIWTDDAYICVTLLDDNDNSHNRIRRLCCRIQRSGGLGDTAVRGLRSGVVLDLE